MKRLLFIGFVILASAFAVANVHAEPGDDTLSLLLSKSELVVSGTITNDVGVMGGGLGLATYDFELRIDDVLKGSPEMRGQTIRVFFDVREGMEGWKYSQHLFERDAKRILFLNAAKAPNTYWTQADEWFAVQVPSSWLADSIKRLEGKNVLKK